MNKIPFTTWVAGILGVAVVLLFIEINSIEKTTTATIQTINRQSDELRDSVDLAYKRIDSLRSQMPGLGEYMSAIQLHISKLWFAGKVKNRDLAVYELNELNEAVDGARDLHAVKNTVNISAVLESIQQAQLVQLGQAIHSGDLLKFKQAYEELLSACNGCHQSAGYKFIHVIIPTAEPVVNQQWNSFK